MRPKTALLSSLGLAYGASIIGGLFTAASVATWYDTLIKPALTPPDSIFGPVWFLLYTAMAVAAWRVYMKRAHIHLATDALILYGFQLALNVLWSVAFFGFRAPIIALFIISSLATCIAILIALFIKVDRIAGYLLIPYLAWVIFATYLNIAIVFLN